MLNEIYEHVKSIANKITITWIQSHVGIKGNEMADHTAQHAITKCTTGSGPGIEIESN